MKDQQLNDILHYVSLLMNESKEDILGSSNKARFVICRAIIVHIIKHNYPHVTLKEMALSIGKSDHSTVIHLLKNMEDDIYKVRHMISYDLVPPSRYHYTFSMPSIKNFNYQLS